MEVLKARLVVVTPMFLGGSSDGSSRGQPRCAETIRGASIKGALRAAFRALNWSRLRHQHANDQDALKALHREESDLFGAAAKDNSGGQARFLIRVKSNKVRPQTSLPMKSAQINYLLGMGLYHFKDGMLRDHIPAGTEFDLELALKPGLTAFQKEQLTDTIRAFGLLGGLGSRGRKGFGSVSVVEFSGPLPFSIPKTADEYKAALRQLPGSDPARSLPPLTAFSKHTSLQISAKGRDAMKLLELHGNELGMYRGYGYKKDDEHLTFGEKSEQNFKADHDWAYDVVYGRWREKLPKRSVFGLPHPYNLTNGGNRRGVKVDASTGRRASPLMAHIHQLPNGEYLLVHALYKAQFLPEQATVAVEHQSRRFQINSVNEQVDWGVVDTFLSRFTDREVIDV